MSKRSSSSIDLGLLPELIGYHLHRAEIASYREFIKGFHKPKYTPKQFSVLILARANPGTSQIAIGKALGMDRATTMTVIDKLQAEKLLTREQSKGDRRKQEINLTNKGVSVTERLVQHAKNHEIMLKTHLTEWEAATLSKLLVKVRTALET